jgi:predicted metal-dependent peptidase
MKKISTAIITLLSQEPFYAHFAMNSRIVFDKFGVPTAGAAVMSGVPVLVFNSTFLDKLSDEEVVAILKHEILHLLFQHTNNNIYNSNNNVEKTVYNIAMDCCINQYIEYLPEGCVTLAVVSKHVGEELPEFETSQFYYNKLAKKGVKTMTISPHDDHDFADSQSLSDKQTSAAAVEKASKNASKASKGNLPYGLENVINGLNKSTINWKQLFRNFIANAANSKTKSTRKKINRRFGLEHPGKKKKKELRLAVCLDSSGSVGDQQFASFIAEVMAIVPNVTCVELIYADSEVQHHETITVVKDVPKMRYGNGGTCYQPAIDKSVQLKVDAIIYFGDFDTADTPTNPGIPFLWVGVGDQPAPADFGHVIRIS